MVPTARTRRGVVVPLAACPALAATVLAVLVAGCGEPGPERDASGDGSPPPAVAPEPRDDGALRPGDSLLDRVTEARATDLPRTLLPEVVAEAAAGATVERLVTLPPERWKATPDAVLTPALRALGEGDPPVRLWFVVPPLVPLDPDADDAASGFVRHGAPVPTRTRLSPELVDEPVFWYPRRHALASLAPLPPDGVELREAVPCAAEFDAVERGALRLGRAPTATDLADRVELSGEVRRAVVLPPPGRLAWSVERWEAERLAFAVGLVDSGWIAVDGAVQRTRSRTDGAEVALEADGTRVWSRRIGPDEVGRWLPVEVDLSAWRGRGVELRFTADAGPDGHDVSDYVVVGGLTARGTPTAPPTRPHVVLVDIDTLRADRLAAYGGRERVATPGLDAWAASRATVYTDAVSTAPWTLPATVSMLTGVPVHQHRVDAEGEALDAAAATLAARLGAAGYETVAFTGGAFLAPRYGCDAGFDRYVSRDPRDIDWSEVAERLARPDSDRPLFAFLHTYLVHQPYPFDDRWVDPTYDGPLAGGDVDRSAVFLPIREGTFSPTEADLAYVEALYDGLVSRMDEAVSAFLEELHARVPAERLLVVFTSDHGEAFLEHGVIAHGQSLHGELLRVPLVVEYPAGRGPEGRPAVGVDGRPASVLDVVPTVLDVVGLGADEALPGRSLRRATAGREAVRLAEHDGRTAVHGGGWKLLEGGEAATRLYRVERDVLERTDLASERGDVADDLRRRRAWYLATHPWEGDASRAILPGAEEIEQLQALGYLGDGGDG